MNIKLIALDIDETLLNDDHRILDETLRSIERAKKQDIKILLTTGRPLMSTKPLLQKLKLDNQNDQYVINYHGTEIQTTSGKLIAANPISFADVKRANDFIKDVPNVDFIVESNEALFMTKPDMTWYTGFEISKNHYQAHFRNIEQMEKENKQHTFYKMMFIADSETLDNLLKNLPNWVAKDYKALRTEDCFFDMINKKVNKGWAVKELAERLGIKQEEVMAVGDGDSDISMVEYAGCGVAMQNGTKALLKIADHVTEDNHHDGVGRAIEKYALNN